MHEILDPQYEFSETNSLSFPLTVRGSGGRNFYEHAVFQENCKNRHLINTLIGLNQINKIRKEIRRILNPIYCLTPSFSIKS